MDPTTIPIKATTQDHLNIEEIQDDLVILKDGSVCLILQTSAVNFGLLSEQEQDATIYAYAGLLNSLTFPIQILVKSQQKDITSYLGLLKKEEEKQKNPLLKNRIQKYRTFIESTVRENNVLDKKFYIIIPFSSLELGLKGAGFKFKKGLPYPKSYILEKAKTALSPKRDHLIRQFNRIGLKITQLKTRQLIELFYKIYNAESIGLQQPGTSSEYETPLVEAAIESQNPLSPPVSALPSAQTFSGLPNKNVAPDQIFPQTKEPIKAPPVSSSLPPLIKKEVPVPEPSTPQKTIVYPSRPPTIGPSSSPPHPIWKTEEVKTPPDTNQPNASQTINNLPKTENPAKIIKEEIIT